MDFATPMMDLPLSAPNLAGPGPINPAAPGPAARRPGAITFSGAAGDVDAESGAAGNDDAEGDGAGSDAVESGAEDDDDDDAGDSDGDSAGDSDGGGSVKLAAARDLVNLTLRESRCALAKAIYARDEDLTSAISENLELLEKKFETRKSALEYLRGTLRNYLHECKKGEGDMWICDNSDQYRHLARAYGKDEFLRIFFE